MNLKENWSRQAAVTGSYYTSVTYIVFTQWTQYTWGGAPHRKYCKATNQERLDLRKETCNKVMKCRF